MRSAFLLVALGLFGGCRSAGVASDPADVGPEALSDTGPAEEADAEPQPAWDPVWHSTTPRTWPELPPSSGLPDCGPGCRVALSMPSLTYNRLMHAFSPTALADSDGVQLMLTTVSPGPTRLIEFSDGLDMTLGPYISGRKVVYIRGSSKDLHGEVAVTELDTGETKRVYRDYRVAGKIAGVSQVAMNDRYVYMSRVNFGIVRRDLWTGQIAQFLGAGGSPACNSMCATSQGLICTDGWEGVTWFFEDATGEFRQLGGSSNLQEFGSCAPSLDQYAWVDYRDSPEVGGDVRVGGEVYAIDLATNVTRRITFDAPVAPRAKRAVAIDGSVVTWLEEFEPRTSLMPWNDISSRLTVRGKLDLATGERCRVEAPSFSVTTVASLHGQHAINYWRDPATMKWWLADVDLSSPALAWKCWKEPAPVSPPK